MAGNLRKLFTNEEIHFAVDNSRTRVKAAEYLTSKERGTITPQLLDYWYRQLTEVTKKNGKPYVGSTVLDRKIRNEEVVIRTPSPLDYVSKLTKGELDNSRILTFSCNHAPYQHPDAILFLSALNDHFKFTRVIHLGDEVDAQALSFYDSDPNLDSAGTELANARVCLKELAKLFPVLEVCHSNHGSRIYRKAKKCGIPAEYIKSYREILFPNGGGDGWSWHNEVSITLPNGEPVLFRHTKSGDILTTAFKDRANQVQGHKHTEFKIVTESSDACLSWGMHPGSLLDRKSSAFAYGDLHGKRPIMGAGIIINSLPILMPMLLDSDGRWIGELKGI